MGNFQNAPRDKVERLGLDLEPDVDNERDERYTDVISRDKNQAVDAPNVAEKSEEKATPKPQKATPRKNTQANAR